MSKTSVIGIIAAVVAIVCTFFPWAAIESRQLVFTGLNTTGSRFGEPGKLNIFLAVLAVIIFLVKNKWVMRMNLFVSGFLLAWSFRNMLLFSRCEAGICPQTGIALYISVVAAVVVFVCVLLTRNPVVKNNEISK
ncbi:hypothetical protein SAMN04488128_10652 [Chitinophaga eiseniae]|uniref:Uncharacterized protein n=1 Tax=Chitinophaga eiseniae TaxID=634771 RepID=A0A1T4TR36_9BACT|nr:hypothetical protein [Chitinophaga eiseniae]SKA42910.1 hypothetical protein SAMN04488128_10652 [Chitinophaga eiseniae]